MVVPSLPALLPHALGEVLRDECPLLSPVLLDQVDQQLILLRGPGFLFCDQIVDALVLVVPFVGNGGDFGSFVLIIRIGNFS